MKTKKIIIATSMLLLNACELAQQGTIDLTQSNSILNENEKEIIKTEKPPIQEVQEVKPILKVANHSNHSNNQQLPAWKKKITFQELPNWNDDNHLESIPALLQSCTVLENNKKYKAKWFDICQKAKNVTTPWEANAFYQSNFTPYQIIHIPVENPNSQQKQEKALLTGYYEPLLLGSKTKTATATTPLCQEPDDLITIDLSGLVNNLTDKSNPENALFSRKLKGQLIIDEKTKNKKVVAYPAREEINAKNLCKPLVWVNDPIDAFFLEIQGSGRIQFENGDMMRVGYANQNGRSYQSIGQYLIQKGELESSKASMQGIKNWIKNNPHRLQEVLNQNPSVVFFRELPANLVDKNNNPLGPLGALNVPLTPERSIAVDLRYHELGTPMFIVTSSTKFENVSRLMMAQDTGGAIRGAVRADFFWGFGDEAGKKAGTMKHPLDLWTLEPKI